MELDALAGDKPALIWNNETCGQVGKSYQLRDTYQHNTFLVEQEATIGQRQTANRYWKDFHDEKVQGVWDVFDRGSPQSLFGLPEFGYLAKKKTFDRLT